MLLDALFTICVMQEVDELGIGLTRRRGAPARQQTIPKQVLKIPELVRAAYEDNKHKPGTVLNNITGNGRFPFSVSL